MGDSTSLKVVLTANLVLLLFYVFFDYSFWQGLTQFYVPSATSSNWYLLFATFDLNPPLKMVMSPIWNIPFVIVCAITAMNLYAIARNHKTKETYQTQ